MIGRIPRPPVNCQPAQTAQLPAATLTRGHVNAGRKNSTGFITAFLHECNIRMSCGHENVIALEWKARWKEEDGQIYGRAYEVRAAISISTINSPGRSGTG
jgi:hypothetical protein